MTEPGQLTSTQGGTAMTLDLQSLWADPQYQRSTTRRERSRLILTKLRQCNSTRLRAVMRELGLTKTGQPDHLTAAEWQALLGAVGASLVEISQVLIQLGLTWQ
jgi:hypothetical protein